MVPGARVRTCAASQVFPYRIVLHAVSNVNIDRHCQHAMHLRKHAAKSRVNTLATLLLGRQFLPLTAAGAHRCLGVWMAVWIMLANPCAHVNV